jgi:hypothetical protein
VLTITNAFTKQAEIFVIYYKEAEIIADIIFNKWIPVNLSKSLKAKSRQWRMFKHV